MTIGSINNTSTNAASLLAALGQNTPQTPEEIAAAAKKKGQAAVQGFMTYMKKTPAEMLRDQWLAAHNLTEEKLKAMTPEQRDAINKQIAEEIKQKMEQEAKEKAARGETRGSYMDIAV